MDINSIIGLISTLLSTAMTVIMIAVFYNVKKRAEAGKRNAILSQLRCKKDEMSRKENKIYSLIDFYKKRVIKKKEFEKEIEREFEQLKLIFEEYKRIKMQLNEEELKNEKEDYSRSIEHIDSLVRSMVGGK